MSFNICRSTLGNLAKFIAIRNASSCDSNRQAVRMRGKRVSSVALTERSAASANAL
jgi:hypothetical protein